MNTLLRRRIMMGLREPTPPPPPTPVFYSKLLFDGTAYIDTDIVPNNNSSFRVTIGYETQKKAQRYFWCSAENSSYIGVHLGSGTTTSNRSVTCYYGSTSAGKTQNMAWSYNSFGLFLTPKRMGFGNSSYTITKGSNAPTGGLVLGSTSGHTGNPFTGTMWIFRVYGSDAQNVTTYDGFSSYTPMYTLRPCTYGGEAGMWCVETSTFYGNSAGAGTLTVSN